MVTVRDLVWSDLEAVHALVSRMDVVRHMLLPLCSREDTDAFLRRAMDDDPGEPWRSIVRGIVETPGGDLVGLCGIVILRGSADGEIWYLVHPDRWGRGIATEAAKQLLDLGFGTLGLHRLWATCLPENPASSRVLEKIGMRKEGFLLDKLRIHGEWKSCFLYAILDEEWSLAVSAAHASA
jgi:RimJ/RimL family protein N-acetyltransferase